jgi:hypothetical protein
MKKSIEQMNADYDATHAGDPAWEKDGADCWRRVRNYENGYIEGREVDNADIAAVIVEHAAGLIERNRVKPNEIDYYRGVIDGVRSLWKI